MPEPECAQLAFASREYWRCQIRQSSQTHYHPTSTCRMGTGIEEAVVNSKLQ